MSVAPQPSPGSIAGAEHGGPPTQLSSRLASAGGKEVCLGACSPGAYPTAEGTLFVVEAPNATGVDLCLFEPGSASEYARVPLQRAADGLRLAVEVQGVGPGTLYGYRAHGPFLPEAGLLFNPKKLLIDPWARRLTGPLSYHPSQRMLDDGGAPDVRDSAQAMLRSVVVDAAPLAALARAAPPRPALPLCDTVLYECHVRGMTARHPDVPEHLRGTYLGLCHEAVVAHLKGLSVNTVSLLPVAEFFDEQHLVARGLSNYWGYAPIAYFAPTARYATPGGDPRLEFRTMVDTFHDAGIEVVVDVVYNHTAEGDSRGVLLAHRGLDHPAFYCLSPKRPRTTIDYTGCGNSLDLTQPTCLRMVMDSLRYWVSELGVDGFRFDLAVTLARTDRGFDATSPFLAAAAQDPTLQQAKLIAEPWDVGAFGYRLGGFPPGWSEWNDRFRDTVRRFFRGDAGQTPDLATRLAGSSDLFSGIGRGPQATVNFVTAHDGFTLRDVVSYSRKHNLANGEDNRDGHGENYSFNGGYEGETAPKALERGRQTTARAMLMCVATAQGIPMIAHGDEIGRTQGGNNNAYCQDNDTTHVDWDVPWREEMLELTQAVFAARARHPCLRALRHLHGDLVHGRPDLSWLDTRGHVLESDAWEQSQLAMRVCGELGDGVLLLVNGADEPVHFDLPRPDPDCAWYLVADASSRHAREIGARRSITLVARSAALFEMRS